jgi:hypothetical protein
MAKEFKDFDKLFSKHKGTAIEQQGLVLTSADVVKFGEGWDDYKWFEEVRKRAPSTAEIRLAVYDAVTSESWQKLRVGMKGLETWQKLAVLHSYLDDTDEYIYGVEECRHREIRVYNYLGALVRGGQLDHGLRVNR